MDLNLSEAETSNYWPPIGICSLYKCLPIAPDKDPNPHIIHGRNHGRNHGRANGLLLNNRYRHQHGRLHGRLSDRCERYSKFWTPPPYRSTWTRPWSLLNDQPPSTHILAARSTMTKDHHNSRYGWSSTASSLQLSCCVTFNQPWTVKSRCSMSASQAPLMDIYTDKMTAQSVDLHLLEVLQRSYKLLQSSAANVHPTPDHGANRCHSKFASAADTPKQPWTARIQANAQFGTRPTVCGLTKSCSSHLERSGCCRSHSAGEHRGDTRR